MDSIKMYLGTKNGDYEYIGDFTDGPAAARFLHYTKGLALEEIKARGIYTEDECVFSDYDTL